MIYFLVNPNSGSGKAKDAIAIVDKIMNDSGEEYSIIYTEKPGDVDRVSSLIDFGAAEVIVCVGGDGTVQEYVGLAVEHGVSFGIIPTGSANDLLHSLPCGIRKFKTFEEKVTYYTKKVICRETINIDAVGINGRYFLNIGGTGIDIQVLRDAMRLKKLFRGASYFIALAKNVFTYKTEEMTLYLDGKAESGRYLLLAFCNGAYYGGKIHIAPPSVVNDGKLTVCIVRKMRKIKLITIFPLAKFGRHTGLKEVRFENCSEVKLEFQGKKTINLDGNLIVMESPLMFRILKGAVNLIV